MIAGLALIVVGALLALLSDDTHVVQAGDGPRALVGIAGFIVAAVGVAGLVTAEFVKPGAAVLDVGISRTADGIQGDVDFDAVQAVAGAITPMPGGTGPMTIGCLMENTFNAARMQGAFA